MNINLKHFRAFVEVAKHLHFGAAADEINVSQPTLTLLIQQLEDALSTRLFKRSTRQVILTEMGSKLLPRATRIINDLEATIDYMQEHVELRRGKVTVAAFPSTAANILPPVIVEFHKQFPEVSVFIIDDAANVVLSKVGSGIADFAVGGEPYGHKDLEFKPLYNEGVKLLLPKGHRLAKHEVIAWSEIIDEGIVTVSGETGIRKLIDTSLAAHGMEIKALLEPNNIHTVLAMTAAGMGPGIVLPSYLAHLPKNDLVALPVTSPDILRPVGMITRSGHGLSPAAQRLHDMIVRHLRKTATL